jgi:hypothetical protein
MSDKTKATNPSEGMSREQLVREHFELHRDWTWMFELGPRFKDYNPSPEAMRHFWEAWVAFTEDRDWEHWRNDATRHSSNEELQAEIRKLREDIKAFDSERSPRAGLHAESAFQAILSGDGSGNDRSHELAPARAKTRH